MNKLVLVGVLVVIVLAIYFYQPVQPAGPGTDFQERFDEMNEIWLEQGVDMGEGYTPGAVGDIALLSGKDAEALNAKFLAYKKTHSADQAAKDLADAYISLAGFAVKSNSLAEAQAELNDNRSLEEPCSNIPLMRARDAAMTAMVPAYKEMVKELTDFAERHPTENGLVGFWVEGFDAGKFDEELETDLFLTRSQEEVCV